MCTLCTCAQNANPFTTGRVNTQYLDDVRRQLEVDVNCKQVCSCLMYEYSSPLLGIRELAIRTATRYHHRYTALQPGFGEIVVFCSPQNYDLKLDIIMVNTTGTRFLCPRAQCARGKNYYKTGTLFSLSKSIGVFNPELL